VLNVRPALRRHRVHAVISLSLIVATACGSDPFEAGAPSSSSPTPTPRGGSSEAATSVVATSVDADGTPTMLLASRSKVVRPRTTSPERAARAYLETLAPRYRLPRQALDAAVVTQVSDAGESGVIVVLRQKIGDVEVVERDAKVLLDKNLSLVAIGGALHPSAFASSKVARFALRPEEATARAFDKLFPTTRASTPRRFILDKARANGEDAFVLANAAATDDVRLLRPVRAKKVYFPSGQHLVPAYAVEILARAPGADDEGYALTVAADDGRILRQHSLIHSAAYSYRVFADSSGRLTPMDGPIADLTPHPTGLPNGTAPSYVSPNLVTIDGFNQHNDPWLPANATETRGNNVDAYTDDAVDGFSSGDMRAEVTAPGVFDRTYDTSLEPTSSSQQMQAAATNAFYVTNWLHDDWYDVGFNEVAGNAQASNYGRGGKQDDALLVEVQDSHNSGKRNNANAFTPSDGSAPRLQFYLWTQPSSGSLTVTPGGTFTTATAVFGPQSFALDANIVVAKDSDGRTDACAPLLNLTGKIALIDRGTCTYKRKTKYAQDAGAVGVIVGNNTAGDIANMGDDVAVSGVMIPALAIPQDTANAIKDQLDATPTVAASMRRTSLPLLDSALDATVIAHEWGHYMHYRLVSCGSEQCGAQSEGWGDFIAMHMSLRPGDALDGVFAMGQYVTPYASSDVAYFGLRRFPYSADFTKNALTFKHITDGVDLPTTPMNSRSSGENSQVHNAGEVWASMLWEAYVALQRRATAPAPAYTFSEARKRMASYIVSSMKLAPRAPTFTEQRDALIAAAFARDEADALAIAQAFARRGAGSCAVSPERDSDDFTGVVESFEVKASPAFEAFIDDAILSCDSDGYVDAGETGRAVARITNRGIAPLAGATLTATSTLAGLTFPKGATVTIPTIAPLATVDVPVEIALASSVKGKQQLEIALTLTAPGACDPTVSAVARARVNVDETLASSTTDDVSTLSTAWTPTDLDGQALASTIWKRIDTAPFEHAWLGVDYAAPSDTALTSPTLEVGAGDFTVSFSHRYQFEGSEVHYDGAVIEVSSDDGATWVDAATLASPTYGGTIGDPTGAAVNTLKDRSGYVDQNADWPARTTETLSFGTALAGARVKLRFRIATDQAVGNTGWEIGDIRMTGATNAPFAKLVDEDGICVNVPTANAGVDQKVASGARVTLDGSASAAKGDGKLAFTWVQKAGPTVTLSSSSDAAPTFTAPTVSASEKLTFELSVRDGLASALDTVDVVVEPAIHTPGDADADAGAGPGSDAVVGTGGDAADSGGCRAAGGTRASGGAFGASALTFALAALLRRRRR